MAKATANGDSFASKIRAYYQANHNWLREASNAELIARYLEDHPGEKWDKQKQQGAANVKSILRKSLGIRRTKKRKGAAAAANDAGGDSRVMRVRTSMSALEQIEMHIDDCLAMAYRCNNPALDGAIKALRVARRNVAWAMGEPIAVK